jgi:Lon protease-like protein
MSMFWDASQTPIADRIPVMVLDGATLFPGTLLPLFIFEPRYRSMLECALETDRLIAIAQPVKESSDELRKIGGVGLIRACVRNKDGTSHLVLHGVERAKFLSWPQLTPFRIAKVEVLQSVPIDQSAGRGLIEELMSIVRRIKISGVALPEQFEDQLMAIESMDAVADIACASLVADSSKRQDLLEEADGLKRLRLLLSLLRSQAR